MLSTWESPTGETINWESPTALTALAMPMVLMVLALIHPRRRRRPVGTLLIWQRALARVGSSQVASERLPWSLRLGLLGLLLVVLAWAGPLISLGGDAPRRLLLVLDRSAEMAAVRADGRTRWQAATQRAAELLRGLADGDEVRLLLVPASTTAPPSGATPSQLASWLEQQSPAHESADWWVTLAAHADAAIGLPTVAITSRSAPRGLLPPGTAVEQIGGRPDNLAVLAASAARLPSGALRVLATVANVGSVSATGELRLLTGTSAVAETRTIQLRPGERSAVSWTLADKQGLGPLKVSLAGDDAWAGDDSAPVVEFASTRLRVGLLLAASAEAERDFLDRLLAAAERVELVTDPKQAELLIVAGASVPEGFAGGVIHLVPPGLVGPAELEIGTPVSRRRLERFSPDPAAEPSFAAGDLAGLPVARVQPLRPVGSLAQRPVLWTDQGEVVAATWTTAEGRRRVALGLSTSRENLPWTNGWLVFWGRLLSEFAPPPLPTEFASEPRSPLASDDKSADLSSLEPANSAAKPLLWPAREALLATAAVLILAGWHYAARES